MKKEGRTVGNYGAPVTQSRRRRRHVNRTTTINDVTNMMNVHSRAANRGKKQWKNRKRGRQFGDFISV